MSPKRIQRKRTKGWLMPPDTIFVGRPTVWGNPFKLPRSYTVKYARKQVERYRGALCGGGNLGDRIELEKYVAAHGWVGGFDSTVPRGWLRGKNLACWCPEGSPCHADVLLELANKAPL